ncbi:MAG: hypothetical protein BMS9Abin36_2259 [Gammaproteobacteria bacterium]|nr:MAG: hypothetical protein BMS9Abin36_2259 [Gammaproteobacteria bacterium]
MMLKRVIVAVIFMFIALGAGCTREASFKQDVYPILQKSCLSCHAVGGKGYAVSGFSVESYESVMKGTKFGPVIVPGSSISSTLVILVEHKADPSISMPRRTEQTLAEHNKFLKSWKVPMLPLEQIKLIRDWIDQGAKNN